MLHPFVIDRSHQSVKKSPVGNAFHLCIAAHRHVTDRGLTPESAVLPIKAKGIPGTEIETVPFLQFAIVGAVVSPRIQPRLIGIFLNKGGNPFVQRFGAYPG